MIGRGRGGRVVNGRQAVELGKRSRPCPVCGAAIGWRCTKTVAGVAVPRKTDHPERRPGRAEPAVQVPPAAEPDERAELEAMLDEVDPT